MALAEPWAASPTDLLQFPTDGQTANFTGDHLNYGFNVRNLTALQVLDAWPCHVLY